MARATRSSTTQEKEKPAEPAQAPRKGAGRKRKRTSVTESSDQPASKLSRVDDDVKEEEASPGVEEPQAVEPTQPELPSSGDVPIQQEDAEKILEILEQADTQGLLDRVFPLSTEQGLGSEAAAGPSTGTQSYSFRALLKSPSTYPLRVLRTAVQHLLPISSHPRSRPSATAAEQRRFCDLALSLLDQSSFHSSPIALDVESLVPGGSETSVAAEEEDSKSRLQHTRSPARQRKYALVQRLPNGDYWTSLASSYPSLSTDGKDLKDLPTAYADLVSVLPAPSSTLAQPPTLGAYIKQSSSAKDEPLAQRKVPCGRFLDYGPYATFAPVVEQDGVEVGAGRLGEVIWFQERERRRHRRQTQVAELRRKQLAAIAASEKHQEDEDVVEVERPSTKQKENTDDVDIDSSLDGLLSAEQIASLKEALGSLEMEKAVQELLDKNARAMARLAELQSDRLRNQGGAGVEAGSEEWETAQAIYDSLTLLASLRPRSSTDAEVAPLVPTPAALRMLHRTLPIAKSEGWYGTLPASQSTTLRDDTTIHIKSGATVPTPVVPTVVAASSTPVATKTPAPPYANYAYSGYAPSAQYRGNYGSYSSNQTSSYYPNFPPQSATAQTSGPAQYPSQYGTTGQQSYAYSSWYNFQTPQTPGAGATATGSGRATPQIAPAPPTNYSPYYPSAATQPTPQRAVANTVVSAATAKQYQQAGWTNGTTATAYVPPTIPAHLRGQNGATSTPGTPTPTSTTTPYQSYYANYQPAPTAAR